MSTPPARAPRILVTLAVVVVAAILVAWAALAILFPPAKMRALVQTRIGRRLAREVRFADAGVRLFPPVRLTIQSPALAEPEGFAAGTAFQARSIDLDLDVPALLRRRIVVRRLILDQPAIHLVLKPDGTTNFDGLVKPEPATATPPSQAMDFTLKELDVRRARLLVDDVRGAARRMITVDSKLGLATRASARRYDTTGKTTLSRYAFGPLSAARLADLDTSLSKLTIDIDHSGAYDADLRRLALQRLDVALGRARLGLSGVVDAPGPKARFDLRARGSDIDVAEILHAVAAADARALHGVSGAGRLAFDLTIRGSQAPGGTMAATGMVALSRASLRYPGAPGIDNLALTARLAPDSLSVPDLAARVAGQPLRGRIDVATFADPRVRFALQGNLDLAAVAPLVAPKDTKLAGRMAVDVAGQGRAKDPGGMALAGNARLANVSVESPAVPKKIEAVNGTIAFSALQAKVGGLTARAGQSTIAVDATVTRPLTLLAKPGSAPPSQVQFDFRSPRLDLAEVLPPSSGPPIVLNATGGGRVAIDRLLNQKLDVQRVRADVALEPGIVNANSFAMNGYGGAIGGSARLDLRDPAKPAIAMKAKLDSLSADALIAAWTPVRNYLQGALSSSIDLSLQGATPQEMLRSLTAGGLAQIANGQLGPGPVLGEIAKLVHIPAVERLRFDEAKLPLHIQNGRIVNDPSVLRGGSYGEWKVAGSVGFDGTLDYAVSATLPPSVTQALNAKSALAAGALTDANGNLLLDLLVSGPARAPRVAWDAATMRDRVAGKVSQAIEEQKQKLTNQLEQEARARQQAAEDSLRRVSQRLQQSVQDSLKRRAGDIFRGFFGGAKDTAKAAPSPAPKDTTARP